MLCYSAFQSMTLMAVRVHVLFLLWQREKRDRGLGAQRSGVAVVLLGRRGAGRGRARVCPPQTRTALSFSRSSSCSPPYNRVAGPRTAPLSHLIPLAISEQHVSQRQATQACVHSG